MDNNFSAEEKLYRAVYPPNQKEMFWKNDGTLSSAAFADNRGLSVNRGDFRDDSAVVEEMLKRFSGCIVYVKAESCFEASASVKYLPSKDNPYHSEIHGSDAVIPLSKTQRRYLAQKAVMVYRA